MGIRVSGLEEKTDVSIGRDVNGDIYITTRNWTNFEVLLVNISDASAKEIAEHLLQIIGTEPKEKE